jgi:hypothetical protein
VRDSHLGAKEMRQNAGIRARFTLRQPPQSLTVKSFLWRELKMSFPDVQRVIYGKNPLVEVVFQVRFPRFLSIETEPPSEFQKLLMSDFPFYEQRKVFQFTISSGPTERSETQGTIHAFMSANRNVTIMLASDSLSVYLTTTN